MAKIEITPAVKWTLVGVAIFLGLVFLFLIVSVIRVTNLVEYSQRMRSRSRHGGEDGEGGEGGKGGEGGEVGEEQFPPPPHLCEKVAEYTKEGIPVYEGVKNLYENLTQAERDQTTRMLNTNTHCCNAEGQEQIKDDNCVFRNAYENYPGIGIAQELAWKELNGGTLSTKEKSTLKEYKNNEQMVNITAKSDKMKTRGRG